MDYYLIWIIESKGNKEQATSSVYAQLLSYVGGFSIGEGYLLYSTLFSTHTDPSSGWSVTK